MGRREYIDGSPEAVIRGTRAEDHFWNTLGLRRQDTPFYGTSLVEPARQSAQTPLSRWHLADSVTFRRSLRLEIETAGFGYEEQGQPDEFWPQSDEFVSVAYWYQIEPHEPFLPVPGGAGPAGDNSRRTIEAEQRAEAIQITVGALSNAEVGWLNKGREIVWSVTGPEDNLTVPFESATEEAAHLVLQLTRAQTGSQFRVELDGETVVRKWTCMPDRGGLGMSMQICWIPGRERTPSSWYVGGSMA